jgi:hypothetical protein
MPGCRDSDISVFCCASAGKPGNASPNATAAPAQARHIVVRIVHFLRRSHRIDALAEMH